MEKLLSTKTMVYTIKAVTSDARQQDIGTLESSICSYHNGLTRICNKTQIPGNLTMDNVVTVNGSALSPLSFTGKIKGVQDDIEISVEYTRKSVRILANTPQGRQKHTMAIEPNTYDNEQLTYVISHLIKNGIHRKRFWVFNALNGSCLDTEFQVVGNEDIKIQGQLINTTRVKVSALDLKMPSQYMFFDQSGERSFLKSVAGMQIIELI